MGTTQTWFSTGVGNENESNSSMSGTDINTLDVQSFTVGPVQENCYLARKAGSKQAVLIDPGEEPQRLIDAITDLDLTIEAILITHCHFDHVGAVAPLARATNAPVYCPEIEVPILADIMTYTWPGAGPYESYQADKTVAGGEALELAGMSLRVLSTPGHSPGHVSYWLPEQNTLFCGDVIFRGSVGRTDLPGASWPTLAKSLCLILETVPGQTMLYPGHMGLTTLAQEQKTNPFLTEHALNAVDPLGG